MRVFRRALVFGVELYADEERMAGQLHHLHQARLRIAAGGLETGLGEVFQVLGIELVAGNRLPTDRNRPRGAWFRP